MHQEQIVNKYIYAFFILMLGIFLFLGVNEFFSSFLGAIVFYTLFKGFFLYLTLGKHLKKSLAAVIIIIISFIIVVLPVTILFTVIYNKTSAILAEPDAISSNVAKFTHRLEALPFKVNTSQYEQNAKDFISRNIGNVLNSSLGILGAILMTYFFLYFLLINANKMEEKIIEYLPFRRDRIMLFGKELHDQTISNAIGVPLVCVAQGLLAYVAYRIAGLPEAGLWGIITGFASVIPLVGTGVVWVPASLYLLLDGHTWQGVFVAAYSIILLSNVDNLIRMAVSNRIGNVHPVITVLGIIVGLKYFGLPGLVFGPLMISYFFILLKLFYVEYNKPLVPETQPEQEKNLMNYLLKQFSLFSSEAKKPPAPPSPPPTPPGQG
jgi:predicted PurR-regulated permease PerM